MPTQPAPDLVELQGDAIRVRIIGRTESLQRWQTHADYIPTTAVAGYGLLDLAKFQTLFQANVQPALLGCMAEDSFIVDYEVESRKRAWQFPVTNPQNSEGLTLGDSLPPFVCVRMRYQTAIRGKKGRGSAAIGNIPESFQEAGNLNGAAITAFNALVDALMQPLSDPTLFGGNVHRLAVTKRDIYTPAVSEWTLRGGLVVQTTYNQILGSQNTRKIGRGV